MTPVIWNRCFLNRRCHHRRPYPYHHHPSHPPPPHYHHMTVCLYWCMWFVCVSLQDAVDRYFAPVFVESECSQCQCRTAKLWHNAVSLPRSVMSPVGRFTCRSFHLSFGCFISQAVAQCCQSTEVSHVTCRSFHLSVARIVTLSLEPN